MAVSYGYGSTYSRIADTVSIEFETGDPFLYSTTTSTVTATGLTSGSTWTATAAGNAYSQPQISLTAAATGNITATVSSVASGETFTLIGAVTSGNVIVVDSLAETVQIGATDFTSLFGGVFPRMAAATACPFAITTVGHGFSHSEYNDLAE